MPQHLCETRPLPATADDDDGPMLEYVPRGNDQSLRIHARRQYAASRDEVYAAWTCRQAWDRWMRLRARSRASFATCRGAAFRLELADGPTFHVVTGTFLELLAAEYLKLGWQHHGVERVSTVEVKLRTRFDRTELMLTHAQIGSRREAAWLMRLWTLALRGLDAYLSAPRRPDSLSGPRVAPRGRVYIASEGAVQRAS